MLDGYLSLRKTSSANTPYPNKALEIEIRVHQRSSTSATYDPSFVKKKKYDPSFPTITTPAFSPVSEFQIQTAESSDTSSRVLTQPPPPPPLAAPRYLQLPAAAASLRKLPSAGRPPRTGVFWRLVMANSKYEYVKREFEFDRRLPASNFIVVRIDGCNFHRYSSALPPKRVTR